jgi:hypothetical protein
MKNFAALALSAVLGFNAQQIFQADTITAKKTAHSLMTKETREVE